MSLTASEKITAADVRMALIQRYCDPEWALLFEVRDATGHSSTRSADAVAMSLWPSRGLELYGMEIKVSRYDWRSERANHKKAETIAAYCDRWFLVTAPGVVDDVSEVPPAWGWLEVAGGKIVERKPSTVTEAKPIDRRFLAALLRRVSKLDDTLLEAAVEKRDAVRREQYEKDVQHRVDLMTSRRDRAVKAIEEFEAASGLKLLDYNTWYNDAASMGRAVKAVVESQVDQAYGGLGQAAKTLRESAEKIEAALRALGLEPHPTPPAIAKKSGRTK